MEIERKWKISGFPTTLPLVTEAAMRQGYLTTRPVVRIREAVERGRASYVLCIKGEGTLVREEIETALDGETFAKLERFIGKPLVTKEFKTYRLPGGELLEVSLVDRGLPTQFTYAEVEFPTVAAARAFVPPDGIGLEEEWTEQGGFSMSSYWLRTRG